MSRWIVVLALWATGCSTTVETSHSWGIAVTEEMQQLLDGAEMTSGVYSTESGLTMIRGKAMREEIRGLLDAYQASTDLEFKDFPRSRYQDGRNWTSIDIVTLQRRRHAYFEVVVDSGDEARILRLIRPLPGERRAQVVVLRDFDRTHEYWKQVATGLVENKPEIDRSWSAFETALRRATTAVDLPVWSNRAPGSGAPPMSIFVPPYSLHPELARG